KAHEPLERWDLKVSALARLRVSRPLSVWTGGDRRESRGLPPPVDEQHGRRKNGEHRQEREKDRSAGDEAEVADALELRDGQDVEGHRGGEGTEQNPGAAARRGALERTDERETEYPLFPIPEQEEDAVVTPEADDDRDEHHGKDRELSDEQRDDAQRPSQAQREHDEHRARGREPSKREHQQAEREEKRQDTGDLAVPCGGAQLVTEERGRSRDAGLDRWELGTDARDRGPDGEDRRMLREEGTRYLDEVDHDVEEASVVGQEVAAVRCEGGGCDQIRTGRAVRPAA